MHAFFVSMFNENIFTTAPTVHTSPGKINANATGNSVQAAWCRTYCLADELDLWFVGKLGRHSWRAFCNSYARQLLCHIEGTCRSCHLLAPICTTYCGSVRCVSVVLAGFRRPMRACRDCKVSVFPDGRTDCRPCCCAATVRVYAHAPRTCQSCAPMFCTSTVAACASVSLAVLYECFDFVWHI